MCRFTLEIRTDNAAFEDGERGAEVARILREAAAKVEADPYGIQHACYVLRDVNGNVVGSAGYVKPRHKAK